MKSTELYNMLVEYLESDKAYYNTDQFNKGYISAMIDQFLNIKDIDYKEIVKAIQELLETYLIQMNNN